MALTHDEIVKLIEKGTSSKMYLARKNANKINMHITGKKVKEFLEILDDYENPAQKKLRTKLVKSNRSLFSFILRPTDKIFTAKGGGISYNLPEARKKKLQEGISEISDGLEIKKYLKKVVKKQYIIDPNGILFIDIDKFGKLETYVINTDKIMWYENKGNVVKGLIFEPYTLDVENNKIEPNTSHKPLEIKTEQSKDNKQYYRVLDENLDRIYVREGDRIYEQESDRLNNYFKFVPAIILGDEKDPNEDIYESLISDVVEDADRMLRLVSTTNVHDLAHLYPRYWSYEQACVRCEGEGQIVTNDDPDNPEYSECISCSGTGVKKRTNASDEIVLPTPQDGDPIIAPNIAGFTSPDLQTAKFYYELIEGSKEEMFESIWGTTHEQAGKRETATGRWLDKQPVQDRLRDISDTFSKFHEFMLDCYGKVLLKDPRYKSSVTYGSHYVMESPYELLDKYVETSKEKVSEITILDLRDRYLEAEHQGIELAKRKKLARIEPFPTLKASELTGLNLPETDVLRKIYFSSWVGTLKDSEIIFLNDDQLLGKLDEYVSGKSLIKPKQDVK